MGEFPAHLFRLGGDPGAIRSSAGKWSEFGTAASDAAGQITALDTSRFVGPEGDLFREGLNESMPEHLRITGEAFGKVAGALNGFAGSLSGLQERMGPLAARAPGLWEALQQAQGRVADAKSADEAHDRQVAAALPDPAGTPDPYRSDAGAASTALGSAQRAWQDCVDAANGVRAELVTAVDGCVRVVDEAKEMRFKENPKWYDLGGQFENFVRDNKELLQQLSGALKIVSLFAGVLSFIPFLAPVMVPLAVGTALAASAIDLSIYATTGEGSLRTVLIDVGLNLLPGVGKLARMGMTRYADDAARATRATPPTTVAPPNKPPAPANKPPAPANKPPAPKYPSKPTGISRQKQDAHVQGTLEYNRRVAQGTPTSAFPDKATADRLTNEAWDKGTPIAPDRPNVRDHDFGQPVGTGPNGGTQSRVRVHMDAQGRIHGHPAGPETP